MYPNIYIASDFFFLYLIRSDLWTRCGDNAISLLSMYNNIESTFVFEGYKPNTKQQK